MSNDFYIDEELEELFGERPHLEAIPLFEPMELGFVCPIDPIHSIVWSEFADHIWCYNCKKDYFSLLCPKQMNPFTTNSILEKETEDIAVLKAKWTLEKYRSLKRDDP